MTDLKTNSEWIALIEKYCPNPIDRYVLKQHLCNGIPWHKIIYKVYGDLHPKQEEKFRRRFQQMIGYIVSETSVPSKPLNIQSAYCTTEPKDPERLEELHTNAMAVDIPFRSIKNLIADINPTEICSHIEDGTLHMWCESWQAEANRLIKKGDQNDQNRAYNNRR